MVFLVVNPETWTWSNTWAVTGLGFGIVLVLLFALVFILMFLGWIMQKITAPKAPKAPKVQKIEKTAAPKVSSSEPTDEGTKAAIAMAIAHSGDEEMAAVAYALHLARNNKHDLPTAMISIHQHETAWNTKSVGMNNVGF